MSEQTKQAKPHIIVTMADGSVKDFGERGKLLSTQETNETGFTLTFHVANGEQVQYVFNGDQTLLIEMAAFGAASKIKAATAGEPIDKITSVILSKVEEFNNGEFVSRNAGEPVATLSQIQQAYANVNGIDTSTSVGQATVAAIFSAMSKEEKSSLYKNVDIAFELKSIQFEAAKIARDLAKS